MWDFIALEKAVPTAYVKFPKRQATEVPPIELARVTSGPPPFEKEITQLPLAQLLERVPELQASFDPETGLPVVQISVRIDSVLDINIESDECQITYEMALDWFDLLDNDDYTKQKDNCNWFNQEYYFQPEFSLRNVIREETPKPAKVIFVERFEIHAPENSAINGAPWRLMHLTRKTMRTVTVKLDFKIEDFPLDTNELFLHFGAVDLIRSTRLTNELHRRVMPAGKSTNSSRRYNTFKFTASGPRIYKCSLDEARECSNTGFKERRSTYPILSSQAMRHRTFIFDPKIDQVVKGGSLYTLKIHFSRSAKAYLVNSLLPVLLILFMTMSIHALEHDNASDKIQILLALFLALFAHRYVTVQQLSTMSVTTIEHLISIALVAVGCATALVFMGSANITGPGTLWEDASFWSDPNFQFYVHLFIVVVVGFLISRYTTKAFRIMHMAERKIDLNNIIIPDFLYRQPECEETLDHIMGRKSGPRAKGRKNHPSSKIHADATVLEETFDYSEVVDTINQYELEMHKLVLRNIFYAKHVVAMPSNTPSSLNRVPTAAFKPSQKKSKRESIGVQLASEFKSEYSEQAIARILQGKLEKCIGEQISILKKQLSDYDLKKELSDRELPNTSTDGWTLTVLCKNQTESRVKRDIRGKELNDKYRCRIIYTQLGTNKDVDKNLESMVQTLMRNAYLLKLDFNIADGAKAKMCKMYLAFDCGHSYGYQCLEIQFLSLLSTHTLGQTRIHDLYRLLRLGELSIEKQTELHQMFEKKEYSLCRPSVPQPGSIRSLMKSCTCLGMQEVEQEGNDSDTSETDVPSQYNRGLSQPDKSETYVTNNVREGRSQLDKGETRVPGQANGERSQLDRSENMMILEFPLLE